jgi:hypothetical protein
MACFRKWRSCTDSPVNEKLHTEHTAIESVVVKGIEMYSRQKHVAPGSRDRNAVKRGGHIVLDFRAYSIDASLS